MGFFFLSMLLHASAAPAWTSTSVTLPAATATNVVATPLSAREGVAIQNNDAATIYCGADNTVGTTGWRVVSGGTLTLALSYNTTYTPTVYCYSAAGTAANAVAVFQVR